MLAIQTTGLSKYYGKNRGIKELNLTVEEGSFFGFIGPNGAGKSTTIRTLLGLIRPTKGRAEIFGKKIGIFGRGYLKEIGYLPSETWFYGGMKVKEMLSLSADLYHKDCRKEAGRLMERLEVDPDMKIDTLSLGNRKKVGIICALQHKPELYILDEPTSGLDPLMQREFFSILRERNREGATIFLSTHVLSEIQKNCSHAAIIREGRLLVSDEVEKIGHTDARRVWAKGIRQLPEAWSVKDVSQTEEGIRFLYDGPAADLMKGLAQLPITDLRITEPDLEEIVLHYYETEGNV